MSFLVLRRQREILYSIYNETEPPQNKQDGAAAEDPVWKLMHSWGNKAREMLVHTAAAAAKELK